MSEPAVRLQRLRIHRMPGIAGGGFALDDLASGLNVVFGPNGSGKSSSARAIQLALDTAAPQPRHHIEAAYQLGDEPWQVEIEATQRRCRRSGEPADPPEVGPSDNRNRYYLALDDLVTTDDAAFAAAVRNASHGGYDVNAAAEALKWSGQPSSPRGLTKQWQDLQRELDAIRAEHRALQDEERELASLEDALKGARKARQQAERLKLAIDHAKLQATRQAIAAELAQFDPRIAKLQGDEQARLAKLNAAEAKARDAIRDAQRRIDEIKQTQADVRSEAGSLPAGTIRAWLGKHEALRDAERELKNARAARDRAIAAAEQARVQISPSVTDAQLRDITLPQRDQLTRLTREGQSIHARNEALQQQAALLEDASDDPDINEADLQQAMTLLSLWLQTPAPRAAGSSPRWPGLLTLGGLAFASLVVIVVALVSGQFLLLLALLPLLIVGSVLAADARRRRKPLVTNDEREPLKRRFLELRLEGPSEWSAEAVTALLGELGRVLSACEAAAQAARQRKQIEAAQAQLADQQAAWAQKRAAVAEQLGLSVEDEPDWLPLLVDAISAWQAACRDLAEAEAEITHQEQTRAQTAAELREATAAFGSPMDDAASAWRAHLDAIQTERESWLNAASELRTATLARDHAAEEQERHRNEREELLGRLGLSPDELHELPGWLEKRDAYRDLTDRLGSAKGQMARLAEQLGDDHADLLSQPADRLHDELESEEREASRHDELVTSIATIKEKLRAARGSHDLEDKLARADELEAQLRDHRLAAIQARVGYELARHVQAIASERGLPQVFETARRLLAQFTHGRYRLVLGTGEAARFRAEDTRDGTTKELEQLSIGERVQTLLAVRLAFVEQQEARGRLPLLMDEVLGTSDDERTAAIIDAVLTIARSGRQVFYFTAQRDEVAKWRRAAEEAQTSATFIDLGELRGLAAAESLPLPLPPAPAPVVPTPDGRSMQAYGEAIAAPGIDPWAEDIGGVHLWHLADSPDELYPLLCQQTQTWGQLRLRAQHETNGESPARDAQQHYTPKARLLAAAIRAWQVGRGRSVTSDDLVDSGAVTGRFMPQVLELLDDVKGDGRNLLLSLRASAVPGFRSSKTDDLETFLLEQGKLATQEPASVSDLRQQLLGQFAGELARGELSEPYLSRVLAALPDARNDATPADEIQT